VVVVPAMAAIFTLKGFPQNVVMHLAIGSSLAAMVTTAMSSTFSHNRRGNILWPIFWQIVPGVIVGTIVGSIVAAVLNTQILQIIFGIFLILVALRMFFSSKAEEAERQLPGRLGLVLLGFTVGVAAGLLGIGGGAISIPMLTYFSLPLAVASGISAGLTLPIAITGAITVIFTGWHATNIQAGSTGYIYWPATILVAIFSVIGVPLGSMLAKRLPVKMLKQIFALILVLTAVELLW
jgi:hypothetical protein